MWSRRVSVVVALLAAVALAAATSRLAHSDRPAGERPGTGADLLNAPAKPWHLVEWQGSAPLSLEELRGRVVVVRFWTDTCPNCARSLPAMQLLAEEFRGQPVQFLGIYHSKPRGSERAWKDAVEAAAGWGLTFPLAYDREWKTVDAWWREGRARVPTSASFVIDAAGRIVHVHPGPEFHPSADPEHAPCDRAFTAIRQAIREALQDARAAR